MNSLPGIISAIQSTDHMSYVTIDLNGTSMKTVILEVPGSLSYLQAGSNVRVLFKETEVILSRTRVEASSIENAMEGTVERIDFGQILTRLEILTSAGKVSSIITTASAKQLKLSVGNSIVASVNTSEIMLSE